MMDSPEWLSALRSDEELARRFELQFIDGETAEPLRALAHQAWEGKFVDSVNQAGHARIDRCVPIGGGMTRTRRVSGSEQAVALWLDPDEDQLIAGFSVLHPPALWLPLGSTTDSIAAALAPYDVKEPARVATLPRVQRWLKEVPPSEREAVESVIERFEPWLDNASWANAHADDPWTELEPARNALIQGAQLREAAKETSERVTSTSYRSLWSRSVLTIEYQPFHCVFVGRYAPVSISAPRAALDELAGEGVPSDVPLDLVASLLRGGNITVAMLDHLRSAGADGPHAAWDPSHTIARCELLPGEPAAGVALRADFERVKDDPSSRELFVKLAIHYRHQWVLRDIAVAEPELVRTPELAPLFEGIVPPSGSEVSR